MIAEKTSQRNKIAMFLFVRVFGLFFLFFLIVAPCSEKVFFKG